MNAIRICHRSIICPFFSRGTWQLSADYIWSGNRTWILPTLHHNSKKTHNQTPPSSTLSNVITKHYCMIFYKAITLQNVPISHVSALRGWAGLRFSSFHSPRSLGVGLQKAPRQQEGGMSSDRASPGEPRGLTSSREPTPTEQAISGTAVGKWEILSGVFYVVLHRGFPFCHPDRGTRLFNATFLGWVSIVLEIRYPSATVCM